MVRFLISTVLLAVSAVASAESINIQVGSKCPAFIPVYGTSDSSQYINMRDMCGATSVNTFRRVKSDGKAYMRLEIYPGGGYDIRETDFEKLKDLGFFPLGEPED